MTWSIRIKCEGSSAISELVLRADLMTCFRTKKQQCPTEDYLLLVCTWRNGDQVGGQEKKHFSPLGSRLHFHVNSLKKLLLFWPPTWSPCHLVANQELVNCSPWWKNYIMIVIKIMIIINYVLRDEHKMVCERDNIILLWFSKVSVLSSPNALFALALRPLGGSFVTLTLFCNTVTGKLLVGMELKNKRKSSCTSASGDERFLIVVSIANIQEAARWQFWKKKIHVYKTKTACVPKLQGWKNIASIFLKANQR